MSETIEPAAIKEKIKQFISENFLSGDSSDLEDDESFLENGIIDSTGVLELVTFTEETFDIDVDDEEMVPENLDSLNFLTDYIRKKLQE
ncbi:MAG: acyl carrier protein [bacterium]|nr:acyl carrier protein [bacterium]